MYEEWVTSNPDINPSPTRPSWVNFSCFSFLEWPTKSKLSLDLLRTLAPKRKRRSASAQADQLISSQHTSADYRPTGKPTGVDGACTPSPRRRTRNEIGAAGRAHTG